MIIENVNELMVGDIETLSTIYNLIPELSSVMSLIGLNPGALYQAYGR
jgi:hypothetical protein